MSEDASPFHVVEGPEGEWTVRDSRGENVDDIAFLSEEAAVDAAGALRLLHARTCERNGEAAAALDGLIAQAARTAFSRAHDADALHLTPADAERFQAVHGHLQAAEAALQA